LYVDLFCFCFVADLFFIDSVLRALTSDFVIDIGRRKPWRLSRRPRDVNDCPNQLLNLR